MVAETTVRKIGNSQGVTIPRGICEELSLSVGSGVRMVSADGELRIIPSHGRTIKDRLAEWDGVRYRSPELDWGSPVGQEMW